MKPKSATWACNMNFQLRVFLFLLLTLTCSRCGGGSKKSELVQLLLLGAGPSHEVTVSTYVGCFPLSGSTDGTGTTACVHSPAQMAIDDAGNIIFADGGSNKIRKISTSGVVTTIAGSGVCGSANLNGSAASFCSPVAVAVGPAGDIFVSDFDNNLIRKIDTAKNVTTYAGNIPNGCNSPPTGGIGPAADFCSPAGIAVDSSGNVYVADRDNNEIRKIAASNQNVTIFAGGGSCGSVNGSGVSASFCAPSGMIIDGNNNLYITDTTSKKIRKVDSSQNVTTIAGSGGGNVLDGTATTAQFLTPKSLSMDVIGNLFVVDSLQIRKIDPLGNVTTFAGNGVSGYRDGPAKFARFTDPLGIIVDSAGNILVSDSGNNLIRKIVP